MALMRFISDVNGTARIMYWLNENMVDVEKQEFADEEFSDEEFSDEEFTDKEFTDKEFTDKELAYEEFTDQGSRISENVFTYKV
ncbi:hypothetical protein J6590_051609 [Homalodisca vitripennis]|nr:hypothetical protein J6590_051609 [Homalodisca vitripennis]